MGTEIVTKTPAKINITLPDGTKAVADGLEPVVIRGKRPYVDPNANVLNYFRSYTYNFTLAGLPREIANDPTKYRDAKLDFVILKSGGKGTAGLNAAATYGAVKVDGNGRSLTSGKQLTNPIRNPAGGIVNFSKINDVVTISEFNKRSAGRFDMFIENVEITALKPSAGNSFSTALSFEIFEPLSTTGFIDALHATAIATGYNGYQGAVFLLKMQFIGYPDQNESESIEVPGSTRYFPFTINGMDVDLTENGTRYRIKGMPFNDLAFGAPNRLTRPVQMSGSTVSEILKDFIKKKNEQITADDKASKPAANATDHDVYDIIFPEIDKDGNRDPDRKKTNKIGQAKIAELLRDNRVYAFADPSDPTRPNPYNPGTNQDSVRYEPGKTLAMFADGANISEIISAIIRDSEYLKNILKTIGKEGTIDNNGMIDFFRVSIEVDNLDVDPVTRNQFKKITYVVTPYKIHFTMIPGYEAIGASQEDLNPLIHRKYNYTYTGKNTDVLSFRLNFNSLFFQSTPPANGNSDAVPSKDGAAPAGTVQVEKQPSRLEVLDKRILSTPVSMPTNEANQTQSSGGNAGPPQTDPYSILAKDLFTSLQKSTQYAALIGELEIIGDPFFLATGGLGNYVPKILRPGITEDNETDLSRGLVLINLNFRNPIDILTSGKDSGMMNFDFEKMSFSGVYMIKKIKSHFKEGAFKQTIEVMRMPNIEGDINVDVKDDLDVMKTRPNPNDQVVKDTRRFNPSRQMPLLNFINGINKDITSILNTPARLASEAGAALQAAAQKADLAVKAALSPITKVAQKINASVQGINQTIFSGAEKLGLGPNQISGLSPTQIVTMLALARRIPEGVDVAAAEAQGISLLPDKLPNVPPTQPVRTAPPAEVAPADAAVEQEVQTSEGSFDAVRVFGFDPAVVTTAPINTPVITSRQTNLPPSVILAPPAPPASSVPLLQSLFPVTSSVSSPIDVRNLITFNSGKTQ